MSVLNENTLLGASAAGGDYEVEHSLRFNAPDTSYLSWTPASTGNNKTWTYSVWIKQSNIATATGASTRIFEAYSDNSNRIGMYFDGDACNPLSLYGTHGGVNFRLLTNACYRDFGGWMHIVLNVDTTQSTASNRIKLYINGEQITSFSTSTYPALNATTVINTGSKIHTIGVGNYDSARLAGSYFNGYMGEVNFIDGQALTPDSFGETGVYGEWLPKKYAGTYGTNGFYLDFKVTGSLGNDAAGSNNWTLTNVLFTDQMLDSPTNNFAVCNILTDSGNRSVKSEGNLRSTSAHGAWQHSPSSISMSAGKWYSEMLLNTAGEGIAIYACVTDATDTTAVKFDINNKLVGYKRQSGNKVINGTVSSYGAGYNAGDIIGMALDMDAKTLTFYKNNASQGTISSIPYVNAYFDAVVTDNASVTFNFGQDSSFAGNKTAQANSDANDIGDFYYAPPSGFLALCTKSLDTPTVIPSEHFNTVLYTGDGSGNKVITVGFQPDFLWIKPRSAVGNHGLWDAVRGRALHLRSNATNAEASSGAAYDVKSFDSDGFTVGFSNQIDTNTNGVTTVAWNWKAGGSASSNTNGTITSQVSANVDAGFSIVSYTGTGANATVGHGLASAPEMIIVKNRGANDVWLVYHDGLASDPQTDFIILNRTDAKADTNTAWNDTAPTSTLFSLGSLADVNRSSSNLIAYCFHSVDGYSKIGSYIGNGSTDGTFVHSGFRPAYVMVKKTSGTGGWHIYDTKRTDADGNPVDRRLLAESSAAEWNSNGGVDADLLSNGFKMRQSDGALNGSGGTYIYLAFAESPFKHSNAR